MYSSSSAERQTLTPREISESLRQAAERKAGAGVIEQFFLAVLAGFYIGFGAVAATMVTTGSLDPGLRRFLAGSVFSVGLMLVIIPGSELFTGNILMTLGLFRRSTHPAKIARNWAVVWAGNFAGAALLAGMMYVSGLFFDGASLSEVGARAAAIAQKKVALAQEFWPCFVRGMLCNMLVCLAVIMAAASRSVSGKILAVYFPIMTFVACDFEHSIANMYFIPAGLAAAGQLGTHFAGMMLNILYVTAGNIVGGLALIVLHPNNQRMLARLMRREPLGPLFGRR
jgi:formate/nitrite transporter